MVGVEYMTFDVLDVAVVEGGMVLTRRIDRVHAANGGDMAELDMMGYDRVADGLIVEGKDYHFEAAAYDSTWGGQGGA